MPGPLTIDNPKLLHSAPLMHMISPETCLTLFAAAYLSIYPGTGRGGGTVHPALKREDRLGKEPFAGFGTVAEDIKRSGYTKNQPILLGAF